MSKNELTPSDLMTAAHACHQLAVDTFNMAKAGRSGAGKAAIRFAVVGLRLYARVPGFDPVVSPNCEKLENLLVQLTGEKHETVQDVAPAGPAGDGDTSASG